MAFVVVTPTAVEDLDRIIATHGLPGNTRARVRASLQPLVEFPLSGSALTGRWEGFRFILGPWSWMLIIYAFDEERDRVMVVTIQDARRGTAPTADR